MGRRQQRGRKMPEAERPNESGGEGPHEKDQGLREAGGPAKRKGAWCSGCPKPGIGEG